MKYQSYKDVIIRYKSIIGFCLTPQTLKAITENSLTDKIYLNIESDFLHDIHSFRECFGHLLHAAEVLHRLFDISVLLQQLKLTLGREAHINAKTRSHTNNVANIIDWTAVPNISNTQSPLQI